MSDGNWYYWSDVERNKQGETLVQCLENYGTGMQVADGKEIMVVYQDATRSHSYSWLLWVDFLGRRTPARLYENDPKVYKVWGGPLSTRPTRTQCAFCQASDSARATLLLCSACRQVYYCSKELQRLHWKKCHTHECKKK
jgi:hypothetical protein